MYIVFILQYLTEGLRKRSMIRPQHVVNRRVEINMLLVLANIPSKFDEKWKFYVGPKIAFLAFWGPCILKTIRDRKKSAVKILKALTERNPMKKNPIKIGWKMKILCRPQNHIFDHLGPLYLENSKRLKKIGCNNSESSHWEESNEKNPIKIGWKIKISCGLKYRIFALLGPLYLKNGKR